MIKYLTLVAILLFFAITKTISGHQRVNGATEEVIHEKASVFFKSATYDSALYYLTKSRESYRAKDDWQGLLDVTIMTARVYVMQARLEKALKEANQGVAIANEHFTSGDVANARALHLIGGISMATGSFPVALENFNQALNIYKQGDWKNNPEVASLYHDIGSLYVYKGELERALRYYLSGLELRTEIFGEAHIDIVSSYESIGVVYAQKFEFERALEVFLKAINIVEKSFGNQHPKLARSLSNTANVYTLMGHTSLALEYLERALAIMRVSFPEEHPNIGLILMNIGIAHMDEGRHSQAMSNFQNALSIQQKVFGEHHYIVAKSLDNVGIIHRKEKRYAKALEYFEEALSIRKSLFGLNHPDVANSFQNIGELYIEISDKLAVSYLEEAARIRTLVLGAFHPDVANAYNRLGTYYQDIGDLESALNAYQKALLVNIPGFKADSVYHHPDIAEYREGNMLLTSLGGKAATLTKLYEQTGDLRNLEFAQETYKLCQQLIDENRQKRMRHEDKLLLGKISKWVYEGAVETSYILATIKKDQGYEADAFLFAERSKAAVLFEKVSGSQAKQFSGLPDSLLLKEQALKSAQSYYQSQLLNMNSAMVNAGQQGATQVREALFRTNEDLDALRLLLEQHYPEYYQLKYQNKILSPVEVQARIGQNQVLIEYFESEDQIFLFVISTGSFSIENFAKNSRYGSMLNQYIRAFSPEAAVNDFSYEFDQFQEAASFLYKQLLFPALSGLSEPIDQLIIIPTVGLAYVPMELLIDTTIQSQQAEDYKNLSYVLNNYAVSYAPSASLLFQPGSEVRYKGKKSVLGFAPQYIDEGTRTFDVSLERNTAEGLRWNAKELDEISEYIRGDYFIGEKATEGLFKKSAKNHGILHLAMHAYVDDEKPMQSRLLFSQNNDSIEDGMLYTYELFNMDLAADMVVLSACKTGLGKIEEGEGIMSLGRAFFYAGSPSIVASSWAVDDQSTSRLMALFYKYISEGETKDQALRKAKIDFLETGKGVKTHPYYWAGFAVIGNTDALSFQTGPSTPVRILFMAILIILVSAAVRKRIIA